MLVSRARELNKNIQRLPFLPQSKSRLLLFTLHYSISSKYKSFHFAWRICETRLCMVLYSSTDSQMRLHEPVGTFLPQ